MQRLFFASWVALGLAACGGKVIVDGNPGGEGGSGGSGGDSSVSTSSVLPSTTSTFMSSSVSTTSVTTGPMTVSSVSTGPTTCDSTGDCFACQECSLGPGGQCEGIYSDCLNDTECYSLLECFQGCMDDQCYQKCIEAFPNAEQPYMDLVFCVLCEDCYGSCDGEANGCF